MSTSSFRLSRDAIRDLNDIEEWIAADNPAAAERVLDAILHTLNILARQPRLGKDLSELRTGLRVFPAARPAHNYLVFFEPRENAVWILRVMHGARDWASLLWDAFD